MEDIDLGQDEINLLGYTFKKMDETDFMAFAGAAPDAWISYLEDERTVLIFEPTGNVPEGGSSKPTISEIVYDDNTNFQRDWVLDLEIKDL